MWWTAACMGIFLALVAFSYRRLVELGELRRWAAPYLQRGASALQKQLSADERRREMAELNEATIEIGSRLERPALVAHSCGRIALSLGAFTALVQSIQVLQGTGIWVAPAVSFGGGCGAMVGCRVIGRMAEQRAHELREEWSGLIRRFARDVAT